MRPIPVSGSEWSGNPKPIQFVLRQYVQGSYITDFSNVACLSRQMLIIPVEILKLFTNISGEKETEDAAFQNQELLFGS